jgi:hypothetical protein
MFKRNLGRLDRSLRIVAGIVLALIGLVPMGGWQGHALGIDLMLFALWPLATGLAGFCGLYCFFGISTVERVKNLPSQMNSKAKE